MGKGGSVANASRTGGGLRNNVKFLDNDKLDHTYAFNSQTHVAKYMESMASKEFPTSCPRASSKLSN